MVTEKENENAASGSSRVLLKNIPPYATEKKLRDRFREFGALTDIKILTKNGLSRQLAFLGYKTAAEAKKCVTSSHRTFLDTYRLHVEIARPVGDASIARPWSKHSKGSSKFEKVVAAAASRPTTGAETTNNARPEGSAGTIAAVITKSSPAVNTTASKTKRKRGVADEDEAAEIQDDGNDDDFLAKFQTGADDLDSASENEAEAPEDVGVASKKAAAKPSAPTANDTKDKFLGGAEDKGGPREAENEKEDAAAGDSAMGDASACSGRLFVRNLPYSCTEDELQDYFAQLGEVGAVKICKDEDTKRSRGFGFVTYVFPEHAVRSQAEMDGSCFQGRLISVQNARAAEDEAADATKADEAGASGSAAAKSSYKKQKQQELKKQQSDKIWNLLYMSANSATDAMAKRLGVEKRDLLDKEQKQTAVTVALGETQILQETKKWLEKEGIWVHAFTRQGSSLLGAVDNPAEQEDEQGLQASHGAMKTETSKQAPGAGSKVKRAKDVFLVKHLPSEAVDEGELKERFARHGEMKRFCLAPSKTVAVVQFVSAQHAERAFAKVNFSRYKHVPLFLEWAPERIFLETSSTAGGKGEGEVGGQQASTASATSESSKVDSKKPSTAGSSAPAVDDNDDAAFASVFVKNLNFDTTEAKLEQIFQQHPGFRRVTLMRKKTAEGTKKSMGYGFIEYATVKQCEEVVKKRQAIPVDGHVLHLQVSDRNRGARFAGKVKSLAGEEAVVAGGEEASRTARKAGGEGAPAPAGSKPLSNKLCVRNVAFETTKGELASLFAPYGTVTSLRLPKKADRSGQHRGFGFVDFLTKSEACAAFEALQHTHLYGRKLVLEPAEKEALSLEEIQEAQLLAANKVSEKEKRKRESAMVGDDGGVGGRKGGSFLAEVVDGAKKPMKKKRKVAS